jgi:hypothetical protein
MRREYLPARIALVANGISMIVLYPLNMLAFERPSGCGTIPSPISPWSICWSPSA